MPPVVFPKNEATVVAEVTNLGQVRGDFRVTLEVDGLEADYRPLQVYPGETETVSFTIIKDSPGDYQISVAGLSVTLTVPKLETYKSPGFPYSISYPADWSLEVEESDSNLITVSGPGVFAQVNVSPHSKETSVAEAFLRALLLTS